MTTADEILEEALLLADAETQISDAISILLKRADRRVPLVMAKRVLQSNVDDDPSDQINARALEIVKAVLERGTWAE